MIVVRKYRYGGENVKKSKDEDVQITPEEREMLRRLMETPGIEREWEFFDKMNKDKPVPPPEYFMRGEPDQRPPWIKYAVCGAAMAVIAIMFRRR